MFPNFILFLFAQVDILGGSAIVPTVGKLVELMTYASVFVEHHTTESKSRIDRSTGASHISCGLLATLCMFHWGIARDLTRILVVGCDCREPFIMDFGCFDRQTVTFEVTLEVTSGLGDGSGIKKGMISSSISLWGGQ